MVFSPRSMSTTAAVPPATLTTPAWSTIWQTSPTVKAATSWVGRPSTASGWVYRLALQVATLPAELLT